jgi:hypothetical protein
MNLEYHERSPTVDELVLDAVVIARGLGYRRPTDGASENRDGTIAPTADRRRDAWATPSQREVPAHMAIMVEEMLAKGRELLDLQWAWAVVPAFIDEERETVECHGRDTAKLAVGRLVGVQLRGACAMAAFVVTIGPRLETIARAMMQTGETLDGYLLDTVGSMAVEAAADVLERDVAALAAARGWKNTNRFSPGYCTWETAGQHALFGLLPPRPAGVALNESSLMSPLKSLSGIIGLGETVEHRPYLCDMCAMETCHQRLIGVKC